MHRDVSPVILDTLVYLGSEVLLCHRARANAAANGTGP